MAIPNDRLALTNKDGDDSSEEEKENLGGEWDLLDRVSKQKRQEREKKIQVATVSEDVKVNVYNSK